MPSTNRTNPIDAHVGERLTVLRIEAGVEPSVLAAAIGVSGQELEAMETGAKRIGAATLMRLCEVLDVPVSRFFEGLASPEDERELSFSSLAKEGHELSRAFMQINDPEQRRLLILLARAMAGRANETDPARH